MSHISEERIGSEIREWEEHLDMIPSEQEYFTEKMEAYREWLHQDEVHETNDAFFL